MLQLQMRGATDFIKFANAYGFDTINKIEISMIHLRWEIHQSDAESMRWCI